MDMTNNSTTGFTGNDELTDTPPKYLSIALGFSERTPDALALVGCDRSLTYRELDYYSARVANVLLARVGKVTSPIGIHIPKSVDAVLAIIGVLRAGHVCVPLDVTLPDSRKHYILDVCGAQNVLVQEGESEDVLTSVNTIGIDTLLGDDTEGENLNSTRYGDLSYILFTSGTTGRPKGVEMPHTALSNLFLWQKTHSIFSSPMNTLQFASLGFDVAFQEIFTALCSGSTLYVIDEDSRKDYHRLSEFVVKNQIARIFMPLSVLDPLLEYLGSIQEGLGLRVIVNSGEALRLAKSIYDYCAASKASLINQYGPTESHVVSQFDVNFADFIEGDEVPIGYPIESVDLFLIDDAGLLIEGEGRGELYISGVCLADGYCNDNTMTDEKFDALSIDGEKIRAYKTGDIVLRDKNGCFYYKGRTDSQIKLNGIRVELREIENCLNHIDGVDRAVVVFSKEKIMAFARISADFSADSDADLSQSIKNELRKWLPEQMIPADIVPVEKFTTNVNGKVDVEALLALDARREVNTHLPLRDVAPHALAFINALEKHLYLESISLEDNFFSLGGNSLVAMKVFFDVYKKVSIKYHLSELFQYPIISDFINNAGRTVRARTVECEVGGERANIASYSQQQMWIESQRFEEAFVYNTPVILRFSEIIDSIRLKNALLSVVYKHEVLRSVYAFDGESLVYRRQDDFDDCLTAICCRTMEDVEVFLQQCVTHPFNIETDIPIRAWLLHVYSGGSVLIINFHHIAIDEWAQQIFLEDLSSEYESLNQTHMCDTRYADYAFQQRRECESEGARKLEYWVNNLAGANFQRGLIDSSPVRRSPGCGVVKGEIPIEITRGILAKSSLFKTSFFTLLFAAYFMTLMRRSGQKDVCIGTPTSLRDLYDSDRVVGCFLNTLIIRADLGKCKTVDEFIAYVQKQLSDAMVHKDVPLEKVVDRLGLGKQGGSRSPFFSMFVLKNAPSGNASMLGTNCEISDAYVNVAKFPLSMFVELTGDTFVIDIEYQTDLFSEGYIADFLAEYKNMCRFIAGHNFSDIEIAATLFPSPSTEISSRPPDEDVLKVFSESVEKYASSIAVVCGDEVWTYQALDKQSNQVANYLIEKGVVPGEVVAFLCVERSVHTIAVYLGILKAGAIYLPLDVKSPRARIEQICTTAECRLAITDSSTLSSLVTLSCDAVLMKAWLNASDAQPNIMIDAESPAYLMYTSGSTGAPKGVLVPHRAIARLVKNVSFMEPPSAPIRCLQMAPLAFDASTFEIWYPLANGGTLVMYPHQTLALPLLREALRDQRVNVMWLTSSVFNWIVDESLDMLAAVERLLVGGEALSRKHVEKAFDVLSNTTLINGYGPTENTTFSCCHTITRESLTQTAGVPIGTPIQDDFVLLLDENLQEVSCGDIGQLYVGGKGLALGYYNDPHRTQEHFIVAPVEGNPRVYATGDLCRKLPNGNIIFIGRVDDQIKRYGMRIELGEIARSIESLAGVKRCHVDSFMDSTGEREIVAFVCFSGQSVDADGVLMLLKQQMPHYMLPQKILPIDNVPLSVNGKIDRQALLTLLPDVQDRLTDNNKAKVSDDSDIEIAFATIVARHLGKKVVDLDQNYFSIGGSSFVALKIISEAKVSLGLTIQLSDFFSARSLREIASKSSRTTGNNGISIQFAKPSESAGLMLVLHNIMFSKQLFSATSGDISVVGLLSKFHHKMVEGLKDSTKENVTLDTFVSDYFQMIDAMANDEPVCLVGHSYGGVLAIALASYMKKQGKHVHSVYLFDSILPSGYKQTWISQAKSAIKALGERFSRGGPAASEANGVSYDAIVEQYASLISRFDTSGLQYDGRVVLFRSEDTVSNFCRRADYGWQKHLLRPIELIDVPGDHFSIIAPGSIEIPAGHLAQELMSAGFGTD